MDWRLTLGDRESFGACYRSYRDYRNLSVLDVQLFRAHREPVYLESDIPAFGGHFEEIEGWRVGGESKLKFV